jgi:lipoprotein-anchoring transpeptidase ErfK/SrfK
MHTGKVQKHIPAYEREAYVRGLDDIGDTYIEIDLTEQKLYAYVDGELTIETDVVTGNERRGWDTPEGVNFVYAKQRNRTLRGPGYASFVKYWMPVKGGVGIHDASWRKKFGGEIFKKDGSHGCINVPSEVMPDLYKMAEVGTPVIMFK